PVVLRSRELSGFLGQIVVGDLLLRRCDLLLRSRIETGLLFLLDLLISDAGLTNFHVDAFASQATCRDPAGRCSTGGSISQHACCGVPTGERGADGVKEKCYSGNDIRRSRLRDLLLNLDRLVEKHVPSVARDAALVFFSSANASQLQLNVS